MTALYICPFCRGRADYVRFMDHDELCVSAVCTNTDCPVRPVTRIFHSEEEAAEAWNRRDGA